MLVHRNTSIIFALFAFLFGLTSGFCNDSKTDQAREISESEREGETGESDVEEIEGPSAHDHHFGWDIVSIFKHSGLAFLKQFTELDSWALIFGTANMTLLLTLDDTSQQQAIENAGILGNVGEKIGDWAGVALNCGLVPFSSYIFGRLAHDEKAIHFGLELSATQLIASLETMLVSTIPFHKRPIIERGDRPDEDQSFVNDILRGRSSFPSGHMVGISTLMFKGWEYFGWKVGVPAAAATIFIGWARVQAGEHYLADVMGTIGLSGIASLATSRTRDLWTRTIVGKKNTARVFFVPIIVNSNKELVVIGQF
ncbi:MAG: phosphatase PAP2 family protein [Proteobacteria bacterium]|nr:phosphatase PAP2 family protein [Pseudomonadota bacterium]